MHILFLNGSEFKGGWRDLTRAMWHRLFVGLLLGMTVLIVYLDPYGQIMPPGPMVRTLIVSSSICVFLLTSIGALKAAAQSRRRIFTMTSITIGVAVASVWGVKISILSGGNALDSAGWAELLAFNMVFATVGEVILGAFMLHRIAIDTGMEIDAERAIFVGASHHENMMRDTGSNFHQASDIATPENTAPPRAATVHAALSPAPVPLEWQQVLGQKLRTTDILHLKAEEHYVAVVLRDGKSLLLRGRLADGIEALPDTLGMQVHRSHWVATAALTDLLCKREGWRLRLSNGAEVPIARNRRIEVRDWAEAQLSA
ncbi:LytTR family DNA-binding domain-containing protein [Pseudorhodobacter sp.]|uniref:LytTR family DNA-binding domain-containing protein n=1 Tax=Pseudorhodobacter sp. TaxID=1934400 RepID=UPI00264933B3|nr:LytTR family DNA-binding domain-containing protein [Pseudorhodobacter sp.]MDN5788451.1 LytTR family transcriptional regulator [Pseudorhodobacter sp.]